MFDALLLLAQAATAPTAGAQTQPEISFFSPQVIGLPLAIGVLFWFMWWSQSRERKRFAAMVAALKRNDQVETVGGVYGTVVEVRDNVIVLKVDENSNVKMRFNRAAIKTVFRDTSGDKKAAEPAAEPAKK